MDAIQATTSDQVRRAGVALARAFHDDPVFSHFLPPGASNREARMGHFMTFAAKGALKHSSLFVSPDGTSAAAWRPPGHWKLTPAEMLTGMPAMLRSVRGRITVALSALNMIEAKHPTEPHWYLEALGTEPAAQGKGGGSLVMQPILDRCDAEGMPAYLESSKERNIPFYERHGFRVTEQVTLPKGGPDAWLMWRDPQPS